jgi:hypothetical protein
MGIIVVEWRGLERIGLAWMGAFGGHLSWNAVHDKCS